MMLYKFYGNPILQAIAEVLKKGRKYSRYVYMSLDSHVVVYLVRFALAIWFSKWNKDCLTVGIDIHSHGMIVYLK